MKILIGVVTALCLLFPIIVNASAATVGNVKTLKGQAYIIRNKTPLEAKAGADLFQNDSLKTGADGSMSVVFIDDTLVSVGPNSVFAIDKYRFDTTTHVGEFEGSLRKGKLAAVSGKMVKQAPESMKIRTPSSVMAVRGTEFVVQVDEPAAAPAPQR